MTFHLDFAMRIGLINAISKSQFFCKASLLRTKQDLQWMEKSAPIMCARRHRRVFNLECSNSLEKFAIWAALCSKHMILAPYVFDENMDRQAYLRMLNEFAFPHATAINLNKQYFRKRSALAHRLITISHRLNDVFFWMSEWPFRSLALTS